MVSKHYNQRSAKRDLSNIINRPAVELADVVRHSLTELRSLDSSVGLIGFEIKQFNLIYRVYYHDNAGNDDYRFEVVVPSNQPYFHHEKTMGLAEKAHALMLVRQSMNPSLLSQIEGRLVKLEEAAFLANSGKVIYGQMGVRIMPRGAEIVAHIGLHFPDDIDYTTPPEMVVKALEWIAGNKHYLIDNQIPFPDFIIADGHNPNLGRRYMTPQQAQMAAEYVCDQAPLKNPSLEKLAIKTNLWNSLKSMAQIYYVSGPVVSP